MRTRFPIAVMALACCAFAQQAALVPLCDAPGAGVAAVATASDNSAFANCILPVLKNNCVSCHGPQKSKGGLRLDSYAALMQGGDDGPAIKPGDAAHSDLLQRLAIPAEDDDHMPPAGKPQPTPEEITLLKWWVDAGASATKTIAELQPSADILKAINAAR